jgi:hypothetical protein
MRDLVTMRMRFRRRIRTGMLRIAYEERSVAVTKIEELKGPASAI